MRAESTLIKTVWVQPINKETTLAIRLPEPSEDDVDSDLDEAEGDVPGHDDAVADTWGHWF